LSGQLTRRGNRVKACAISELSMRGLLLAFLAMTSAGSAGGSDRARFTSKTLAKSTATAV
jgi:hypothetical protein